MGEEEVLSLALEGRIHAASGQTAELVALAGNLALLPDPEIDATWANALEARLLGETAAAPVLSLVEPAAPAEPLPTNVVQMPMRRFVVRRALAGAVAAAMLSAFPVVAVAGSLPGTPGYGVKRSVERFHLAMFGTPVEDGFTHMDLAQRRVFEASQLIVLGFKPSLISATLRDATIHVNLAGRLVLDNTDDPALLRRLSDASADTQRRIAALLGEVPENSKVALQGALDASIALQVDVARLLGQVPGAGAPVASIETVPQAPVFRPQPRDGTDGTTAAPTKPTSKVREKVRETDPGEDIDEAARTCPVLLQDQGLGDTFAPVSKELCPLRDATY